MALPAGMKKRLGLFLSAAAFDGGVYQYSQSVLRAFSSLPKDEFDCIVICARKGWAEQAAALGLQHRDVLLSVLDRALAYAWVRLGLPVAAWRKIAALLHPLTRTLLRERCDLWIFPAQDRWAYLAPVPALGVILDLMHRYQRRFPEFSRFGRYTLRENHYSNMCRWAYAVLVDSECGKQQAHESYGLALERILPLPLVVPPGLRSATTLSGQPIRFDDLPKKFFFYPAQFWPHKNHARLIRALARLHQTHPDSALILTGAKAGEYPRLLKLSEELGVGQNVHFLGYVTSDEMIDLYRRARALVMPTFFGPTNTPPMEAMALGCPVAVSNLYAMPEQVGDAGLCFDPESEEEIATALLQLWTDDALCRDLRERGYARSQLWGEREFDARFSSHVHSALSLGRNENEPAIPL